MKDLVTSFIQPAPPLYPIAFSSFIHARTWINHHRLGFQFDSQGETTYNGTMVFNKRGKTQPAAGILPANKRAPSEVLLVLPRIPYHHPPRLKSRKAKLKLKSPRIERRDYHVAA